MESQTSCAICSRWLSDVPGNCFAEVASNGYAAAEGAVVMVGDDDELALDGESLPHPPALSTASTPMLQMAARREINVDQCSV